MINDIAYEVLLLTFGQMWINTLEIILSAHVSCALAQQAAGLLNVRSVKIKPICEYEERENSDLQATLEFRQSVK